MLTKEQYISRVMAAFLALVAELHDEVRRVVEDCYVRGFSLEDAVSYTRCYEGVTPDMKEDEALRRMAEIQQKYQK